jgi:hypothetical protein
MSRGEKPRRATKTGLWLIVQNSKHLIMAFGYEPFFHMCLVQVMLMPKVEAKAGSRFKRPTKWGLSIPFRIHVGTT